MGQTRLSERFVHLSNFGLSGQLIALEALRFLAQTVSCKLKKMTAKDKQIEFIKSYLKPKLKDEGFRTAGQTWWKIVDDFAIVINLQNSQWNSQESLSFCFNIGVGLTEYLKDPSRKKATYFDIVTKLREDAYLSDDRKKNKYRPESGLGYTVTSQTNLADFISELSIDFESDILPKLGSLKTLQDCLDFYRQFDFWGEQLQNQVDRLKLKSDINHKH
ncbi:MAG: DUF4304 domain-containing protein [Oceanospirillaceae bacterium]|nr:DUF4304 domain-containing protein [Oceanospirillaceae bacterium]